MVKMSENKDEPLTGWQIIVLVIFFACLAFFFGIPLGGMILDNGLYWHNEKKQIVRYDGEFYKLKRMHLTEGEEK